MKIYNMYETIMAEYWKFLKQPKNVKFSLRVSHNNLFHLSPSEDALGRRLGGRSGEGEGAAEERGVRCKRAYRHRDLRLLLFCIER